MKTPNNLSGIAQKICHAFGFRYIEKVGEGAFKETFYIETSSNEALALKVYRPDYHEERSEREIRAMQKCDHLNIAQLNSIDMFSVDGTKYLFSTEEFLRGKTLREHLEKNGLMDIPSMLALGTQLISAIAHIASHDLVHRDIKLDNILLRGDYKTPVIVDFGIVRDLSAESLTSTWLMQGPGTPLFAAPEQLNNEKELIDWRTDQFALGIVLGFCAFGKHPYDTTSNNSDTVQKVAQRCSQPSQEFIDNVQKSRLFALEKMVALWPSTRYRTSEDLSTAWSKQGDI